MPYPLQLTNPFINQDAEDLAVILDVVLMSKIMACAVDKLLLPGLVRKNDST